MNAMIGRFMLVLRTLLTIMGALALLYTLSYPDSLMPPSPHLEYVPGFKLYDLKPLMFLAPLLLMEMTSGCGPRRNAVWFFSLGLVFVAALIAWPVLQAHAPEWVRPTLYFEDGKLAVGLKQYTLIMVGSFVFRKVLLDYLFREHRRDEDDPIAMDPVLLDPAKGKTVQEIAATPEREAPRFLFGDADHGLINRFYALMHRLATAKRLRHVLYLSGALALVLWFFFYPQPTEQEALQRDIAAMYGCRKLPRGGYVATHRAVHAAYRVMCYVADHEVFAGMTPEQAAQWLQVYRAPEAYRRQLLDDADITLPSVEDMFQSRTRFFTVQDGRRISVLYVRTDRTGEKINISEVQDAGWNDEADALRRRFGMDVAEGMFRR